MSPLQVLLRFLLLFVSLAGGATASPSLTLLVDGVSPLKSEGALRALLPGLPTYPAAGYLAASPLARALEQQGTTSIHSLVWNGDPTDRAELRRVSDTLEAVLLEASLRDVKLHLITHSLGSAIASRALSRAAARDLPGYRGVATLITLSSPLGHAGLMATLVHMHPELFDPAPATREQLRVGRWLNIFSSGDVLSRPILAPGVENLALPAPAQSFPPNPLLLLEAHKQPFKDPEAINAILSAIGNP
jgi:pimeloyl-ACP methyl ester carboxylesterase